MKPEKSYQTTIKEIKDSPCLVFSREEIIKNRWVFWALHHMTFNRLLDRGILKSTIVGSEKTGTRYQIAKADLLNYLKKHKQMFD